jgi:enoyl-CoA hydratase/carnithine racemase
MQDNANVPTSTPPVLTIADGKARVQLNRPAEHNRLEPADLTALVDIFDTVASTPEARVLIITGTGKSFSSGFHIGALKDRNDGDVTDYDPNAFEKMVDRLEDLPLPTIAALNGGVYGGATDLALACDFRIGVEGMRMFMPAARLGIVYYESGLRRYVSRLGLNNAKRLFLTAEPVEAEELVRMGYLDRTVPAAELQETVDALAAQLGANAPLALAATKKALNDVARGTLDPREHARARAMCAASEDHQEGLRAWAEKRTPTFKGK